MAALSTQLIDDLKSLEALHRQITVGLQSLTWTGANQESVDTLADRIADYRKLAMAIMRESIPPDQRAGPLEQRA